MVYNQLPTENSPYLCRFTPALPALRMPYTNDPRRTVTLNFHPDEYEALAEDALEAGYATPGTYALAVVRERGDAPDPIRDERTEERVRRLEAKHAWLLQQFETAQKQLRSAGRPFQFTDLPEGEYRPRSRAAQERAVERAREEAVAQERARVAKRRASHKAAQEAAQSAPVPPPRTPPRT